MKRFKIFMLHRVLPSFNSKNYYFQRKTAISWQRFIKLLDLIESKKWQAKPLSCINDCNPKTDVFISFDDGYIDNAPAFHEILQREMSATLFPVKNFSQNNFSLIDDMAHHLNKKNTPTKIYKSLLNGQLKKTMRKIDDNHYRKLRYYLFKITEDAQHGQLFFTEKELIKLNKLGIELGIHGTSHRTFTSLTQHQLNTELEASQKWLFSLGAKANLSLCFPHGKYNHQVITQCSNFSHRLIGVDTKQLDNRVYRRIHITEDN